MQKTRSVEDEECRKCGVCRENAKGRNVGEMRNERND